MPILLEDEIERIALGVKALLREHKTDINRAYFGGELEDKADSANPLTVKLGVTFTPHRKTEVNLEYDRGKVKNRVTLDDQLELGFTFVKSITVETAPEKQKEVKDGKRKTKVKAAGKDPQVDGEQPAAAVAPQT